MSPAPKRQRGDDAVTTPQSHQISAREAGSPAWTKNAKIKLQRYFDKKMKNPDVLLLSSFEKYVEHLPSREVANMKVKLYERPYYVRGPALYDLATGLANAGTGRTPVVYMAAPSHSGKTAAVLHGFLKATEIHGCHLSHYLYMPFDNNINNHHSTDLCCSNLEGLGPKIIGVLGCVFISECLEKQLGGQYCRCWSLNKVLDMVVKQFPGTRKLSELSSEGWNFLYKTSMKKIQESLQKFLGLQEQTKINPRKQVLLHVDEHRKMFCPDFLASEGDRENCRVQCAHFRRGAMLALAAGGDVGDDNMSDEKPSLVKVIATYIDAPVELAATGPKASSQTCRFPIPKPSCHIAEIMDNTKELRIPEPRQWTWESKRLLSTLQVALGMLLEGGEKKSPDGLKQGVVLGELLLQPADRSQPVQEFLHEFQQKMQGNDRFNSKLKECTRLCRQQLVSKYRKPISLLVERFKGIPAHEMQHEERIEGGVVLVGDYITAPLDVLLTEEAAPSQNGGCSEHDCCLYRECQRKFSEVFESEDDLCSGLVLERAFLWALALHEKFPNLGTTCNWNATRILPSRIFEPRTGSGGGAVVRREALSNLQRGILYYADEGPGNPSHPFVDLWFVDNSDTLVLVEVGGSCLVESAQNKKEKLSRMVQHLKEWKDANLEGLGCWTSVIGIVLLPNLADNAELRHHKSSRKVHVLTSTSARRMLGGLSQLVTWLDSDADPADIGSGAE